MFLTKDNKIKWKKLGIASAICALLIFVGLMWVDKPLYLFMRELDCKLCTILDRVFNAKVWLVLWFVVVMVVFVNKARKTGICYRNERNRISIRAFVRDCFSKIRYSYAFFIFCAVLSASVVTQFLKVVIGRFRPLFFEALDMTGFHPFTTEWAFNSMPSGHAAATFAGLVMIGLLVPRFKWLTWTVAIIVGASRVAYGAHWPTDVLFGAFIGMVAADMVKAVLSVRDGADLKSH